MDKETTARLLALNREFYATFARPFAASRPTSDPALVCILPYIPQRASVLDVGCGNGRLALLLDRERPGVTYLGVDAAPELVALARAQAEQLTTIAAEFRVAPVAGLANDLDAGLRTEKGSQPVADNGVIVGEEDGDGHRTASTMTRVPC
ncbi:MAG: methyltransferase domain-containing protein [Anaerolineae bacterium]|nr:methyltransferase domain-containing protein [Anaerolineae bacterium]